MIKIRAAYAIALLLLPALPAAADEFADAMKRADSLRAAKQYAEATSDYRELAIGQPDHPQAADAHRNAILSTADLLRASDPTVRTATAPQYEEILREHLERWPTHATSNEARFWLAGLLSVKRDWTGAISTLEQITRQSDSFAPSVPLYVRCCEQQLTQLNTRTNAQASDERVALLSAANKHLQPVITGDANHWPAEWTQFQCDTALALARLHLQSENETSTYAERLLAAALNGHPAAGDAKLRQQWEGEARLLLISALVRNGHAKDALDHVAKTGTAPPAAMLDLLAELDKRLMRVPQEDVGQIVLAIARNLETRQTELEPGSLPRLAMVRATALAATGDRGNAVAQFADLSKSAPNDAEIQERYALLLSASDSADDLRVALARWQEIESRTRRGGPRWRRARQMRIDLLTRTGNQPEADKLIKLTKLLYPDWPDDSQAKP